jgi:hypothetical protein
MVGSIKTTKTVTFTCCVCKMKLEIDTNLGSGTISYR